MLTTPSTEALREITRGVEGYLLQHHRSMIPTTDHPVPQRHMPPHCGTCRWNMWEEDGPHCRCLDRIPMEKYDHLLDDDAGYPPEDLVITPEYNDDGGDIEYHDVCGHYVPRAAIRQDWRPTDREREEHKAKVHAYLRAHLDGGRHL